MSNRRANIAGVGGASLTIAPWEHPVVWEFVGKGRYLQAAFCRSAAQLYSAKFGSITLKSLSNIAAEKGFVGLVAWSKDIGCCWDESVFASGAKGGSVDVLTFLKNNDCPITTDARLCRIAGAAGHLEALRFLRQSCGCIWDKAFSDAVAKEGRLEILQYAHAHHSECSEWDSPGWDSRNLCTVAAEEGHIHVLEWAHETLHEESLFDATTCEAAACAGRLDSLRYLRSIGCAWDGETCWAAVSNGNLDVLKWAIDNGCPWGVHARDRRGGTGLHYAQNAEVIEFLISRGADINAVDKYGETPLHWLADSGKLEAVKTLVKAGADVNITDVGGTTPLSLAIDERHHDTADVLREAGAR